VEWLSRRKDGENSTPVSIPVESQINHDKGFSFYSELGPVKNSRKPEIY
jgi:hypothetical protein